MNIEKTTQDGIATLKLTGWLETQAAVELQGALDLAAAKQAIKEKGYTCTGVKG